LLADVLELANRKDAAGEHLMHQMSKPRPAAHDDPKQLHRLGRYCVQDVEVEREVHGRVSQLSAEEQALWVLHCRINERGFHVDRPFAEAARRIAEAVAPEINAELADLTGGAVTKINQVDRLQQGCTMENLNHKTVEKLLGDDALAAPVRRVLELRLGGAQAAVKKIHALFACADSDDRVRGVFRYHGAATGRFSGERFQPQNLKRPTVEDLDAAITAIATGEIAHVKKLYPKPLAIVGDCIRSMICAAPGHVLFGVDLSAIESRVLAWLVGENWKLDAYRRFDLSQDPRDEPYCETACKIFRVPSGSYTKGSQQRDVGKTCDLAFGFMGGVGAWRKFEPDKFTDEEVQTIKNEWRAAHPAIVAFWYDIDSAAVLAVRERGRVVQCGRIELKSTGAFLQLQLPSGRKISYPQPRIIVDDYDKYRVVFADNAAGQFKDCRGGKGAYGGTWTENVVSGIARDLLAEAMLRVEAAGYPIVLHVHDELVCEVPIGFGSTEEFTRLMTQQPSWAPKLPIAASAWTGLRYCK
jgi:DNA polymerase